MSDHIMRDGLDYYRSGTDPDLRARLALAERVVRALEDTLSVSDRDTLTYREARTALAAWKGEP